MSSPGRVLAIDPGKVRVGVALSDEDRVLATPRKVLEGSDRLRLVTELAELCREEGVTHVLIGLPRHMNGDLGGSAAKILDLAQRLADATKLEVELCDERLTTVEATRKAREAGGSRGAKGAKRTPIDDAAAAVMLQAWLDGRARR